MSTLQSQTATSGLSRSRRGCSSKIALMVGITASLGRRRNDGKPSGGVTFAVGTEMTSVLSRKSMGVGRAIRTLPPSRCQWV